MASSPASKLLTTRLDTDKNSICYQVRGLEAGGRDVMDPEWRGPAFYLQEFGLSRWPEQRRLALSQFFMRVYIHARVRGVTDETFASFIAGWSNTPQRAAPYHNTRNPVDGRDLRPGDVYGIVPTTSEDPDRVVLGMGEGRVLSMGAKGTDRAMIAPLHVIPADNALAFFGHASGHERFVSLQPL